MFSRVEYNNSKIRIISSSRRRNRTIVVTYSLDKSIITVTIFEGKRKKQIHIGHRIATYVAAAIMCVQAIKDLRINPTRLDLFAIEREVMQRLYEVINEYSI